MARRRQRQRAASAAARAQDRAVRGTRRPAGLGAVASARVLGVLPLLAVLVLLGPYVWPLDHAPDAEFSDIHHLHLPYVELLATGLSEHGAPPRWNPQDFAGVPTVGDPQAGIYNPLYWLLALHPTGHGFGLLIVAYALAGALAFQLYARAHGASPAAAAAGAMVFIFGGSVLLRLVLPGHIVFGPLLVLPGLLWLLERVVRLPTARRVAGGAGLVALLIVVLHPQALLYAAVVAAALILPPLARAQQRTRAVLALGAIAALGIGLACVHLLPIVALAGEFSRGQAAFQDSTPQLSEFVADLAWLAAVVNRAPDAAMEWESHLYLGSVGFFLVGIGLFAWPRGDERRRLAWLHGLLTAGLLAFALGSSSALGPFRMPTRALTLLGLPLGMLTALGVDALGAAGERRRAVVTGTAWLATLLLVLAGSDTLSLFLLLGGAGGALLLGATAPEGVPAGAVAPTRVPAARLVGAGCLIMLLAWDTGRIVAPWVQTAPEAELGVLAHGVELPEPRTRVQRIAELERGAVAPGIPELAVRRLGLETLAGYNPLIPWRFVLFASRATGLDPFAYRFDIAVPLLEEAEPVLFDLLGVSHVLRPLAEGPPAWEWTERPHALPRAYLVPGPIVVPEPAAAGAVAADTEALDRLADLDPRRAVLVHGAAGAAALAEHGIQPDTVLEPFRAVPVTTRRAHELRLDVRVERPAVLVLNEPFVRGWRAWDDGEELPVVRVNVLFRGLVLAPGTHRLHLEFAPGTWVWGRRVSVLALLVVGGLLLGSVRRRAA